MTVNRVVQPFRGEVEELSALAKVATQLLTVDASLRQTGTVEVLNLPSGAVVTIDDTETDLNEENAMDLDPGAYKLGVFAGGYEPLETYVIVEQDQITTVDGQLESTPLWTQWWLWTSIGVVTLGTVALGIAGFVVTSPGTVNTLSLIHI